MTDTSTSKAAWLALLCVALGPLGGSACDGPRRASGPTHANVRGAPIRWELGVEHAEIARLEDEQPSDASELIAFLRDEDPRIRRRAAVALGRFPHPVGGDIVTGSLCRALADPVPDVRLAAAYALGFRADPSAAGCLVNFGSDADPRVRAALARASGHLDVPASREVVLRALRDPDAIVRTEAAQATALWTTADPQADSIDSALLALLTTSPAAGGGLTTTPELVWRTLYALSRRRSEKGLVAFLQYATSHNPLARLFSMRGLSRARLTPRAKGALIEGLSDDDWRVACEAATGLGRFLGDADVATALLEAVEHRSHHVRREALTALGKLEFDTKEVRSLLWRGARDLSASVRADAAVALARLLPGAEALSAVEDNRRDSDPIVRSGAARAAAELDSALAVPILVELSRDKSRVVAQSALAGLGRHPTAASRAQLLDTLAHPDNGIVLAAVEALRSSGRGGDVPRLRDMLETVQGDIATEIALAAVENLAIIGSDSSRRLVERLASHPDRFVRDRARAVLADVFETPMSPIPRPTEEPPETEDRTPRPGRDYPTWPENPLIEIRTTRGPMVFELFASEAPIHVHNLLSLATEGHYDGRTFHRVVPDFVVQGGDYRGDGNGGGSWRDTPLRNEFGPRKFVRGSLGMPRYADPDSGGHQFFATLRPTPHLDGRYTVFGELREGGAVLDETQVGDRILSVRLIDPAPVR